MNYKYQLILFLFLITGCGKETQLRVVEKKKIVEVGSFGIVHGKNLSSSLGWLANNEILFTKNGAIWKADLEGNSKKIIDMEWLSYPEKESIIMEKRDAERNYEMQKMAKLPEGVVAIVPPFFPIEKDYFVSIALSPDKRTIAFSAYVINTARRTDLVIGKIDITGQNMVLFRKENSIDPMSVMDEKFPTGAPSWSPDGKEIAFHKCIWDRERENINYTIWRMDVLSGNSKEIIPPGDYTYPVFFPDGKSLLYKKYLKGNFREMEEEDIPCSIGMIELSSSKEKHIYVPSEPIIGPCDLSPDGKWIVFTSQNSLWAVKAKKPKEPIHLLSFDEGIVTSPSSFSPDGKKIAVVMQTRDYPKDSLFILSLEDK